MLKSKGLLLSFIFILAFCLRLWFILDYSTPIVADELDYDRLAVSILEGKGYVNESGQPTAQRPPGYPLFLSMIYFIFGRNFLFVRIIQALIDSFLCILIFYLGKEAFNEKIGVFAGILAALHLGFVSQSAKILTEGLSTFFLLVVIICFYKAKQNHLKKKYYFLTGFILGITSLIRSNLSIVFPLIAITLTYYLYKKNLSLKKAVKYLAIYTVAYFIPILPWTIRNYDVFHAFVPISTYQGIAFYTSYTPQDGKIYGNVTRDDVTKTAGMLSSEAERSNFLTKETLKLIGEDPAIFFKLLSLKMAYLFSPFDWGLIPNRVVYNYLYVFCFPFFLYGSFMLLHRFNELLPFYIPILGIITSTVVFFGIPRFRVPVEPYMILISCWAIIYVFKKTSYKKLFVSSQALYLLGNFLLFLNSSSVKQACKAFLKKTGLW